MQVTYHGTSYESNPSKQEFTEGGISGEYCGTTGQQKYLRHIPVHHSKVDQQCHDITHNVGDLIDVETTELRKNYDREAACVPITAEACSNKSSRQQALEELRNTQLDNIRRKLEHRLQVAREKGDEHLIYLLEAEAQQLAVR